MKFSSSSDTHKSLTGYLTKPCLRFSSFVQLLGSICHRYLKLLWLRELQVIFTFMHSSFSFIKISSVWFYSCLLSPRVNLWMMGLKLTSLLLITAVALRLSAVGNERKELFIPLLWITEKSQRPWNSLCLTDYGRPKIRNFQLLW